MTTDEALLVGQLRKMLSEYGPETEITFGSSAYRKKPVLFLKLKDYDTNTVLIEFCEIEYFDDEPLDHCAEIDNRLTVREFLRTLEPWEDTVEVAFGTSLDGVPFELRSITPLVGFNLEQNREPRFVIR